MAITVEVRKGDTTRQMSEYSYMLLPYANGARGGWVYIRHITGSSEGFDPAGNLNTTRPTEQTTAMAQPFIPDEISKRLKTSGKPGSDNKVATAIDPNAGATDVDPKDTTVDPGANAAAAGAAGAANVANAGSIDPNAGATNVATNQGTNGPGNSPAASNNVDDKAKAKASATNSPKSKTDK